MTWMVTLGCPAAWIRCSNWAHDLMAADRAARSHPARPVLRGSSRVSRCWRARRNATVRSVQSSVAAGKLAAVMTRM